MEAVLAEEMDGGQVEWQTAGRAAGDIEGGGFAG
jgi:hypothetical protein